MTYLTSIPFRLGFLSSDLSGSDFTDTRVAPNPLKCFLKSSINNTHPISSFNCTSLPILGGSEVKYKKEMGPSWCEKDVRASERELYF